jgi:hypothetical protein
VGEQDATRVLRAEVPLHERFEEVAQCGGHHDDCAQHQ